MKPCTKARDSIAEKLNTTEAWSGSTTSCHAIANDAVPSGVNSSTNSRCSIVAAAADNERPRTSSTRRVGRVMLHAALDAASHSTLAPLECEGSRQTESQKCATGGFWNSRADLDE